MSAEQHKAAQEYAQKHWEWLTEFHRYKQGLFEVAPKRCTGNY